MSDTQYAPNSIRRFVDGIGHGLLWGTPGILFALTTGLAYQTTNEVAAIIFLVTTALVAYSQRGDD